MFASKTRNCLSITKTCKKLFTNLYARITDEIPTYFIYIPVNTLRNLILKELSDWILSASQKNWIFLWLNYLNNLKNKFITFSISIQEKVFYSLLFRSVIIIALQVNQRFYKPESNWRLLDIMRPVRFYCAIIYQSLVSK